MEFYAGVPHLKGDSRFNRTLAGITKSTQRSRRFTFGGFSTLFDLKQLKVKHPLLVGTTDGVGTKLDLARWTRKHNTIGIDLVAMSVNDLITCGAKPVFFLDYFAAGTFDRKRAVQVIRGIATGCKASGCALVGGETAIMPGFYAGSTYDLAGFALGVVERAKVIDGKRVKRGHVLLGLASSGVHSNGFSLVRKVFTKRELSGKIGRKLLVPTRIYVKPVLEALKRVRVDGIAHITGGGLFDNVPRMLPRYLGARIRRESWPVPAIFSEIGRRARYNERKLYHTFNMGIGMVLALRQADVKAAQQIFRKSRISSYVIGTVENGNGVTLI